MDKTANPMPNRQDEQAFSSSQDEGLMNGQSEAAMAASSIEAEGNMTEADIQRQRRMAILAQANVKRLMECWTALELDPQCELIRGPETGLIALRGRIGGGGAPFNFGEATLTRATVRLQSGAIGHAAMLGRDQTKAKLAAVIDALATEVEHQKTIEDKILVPLEQEKLAEDRKQFAQSQATKVNFFTMVRGED